MPAVEPPEWGTRYAGMAVDGASTVVANGSWADARLGLTCEPSTAPTSQYSKRPLGVLSFRGSVDGRDRVNLYLESFVGIFARHYKSLLTSASQVVAKSPVRSRFQLPLVDCSR
jgi:hypothetical protein